MLANEIYEELKLEKEKLKTSFSDLIRTLLHAHKKKSGLFKFYGALEGDEEYTHIRKNLKKEWSTWQKKYV